VSFSLSTLTRVEAEKGLRIIPVRGSTERTGHRFDPSRLDSVVVTANRYVATDTFVLSFTRPWDFVPGQSVALTVDRDLPPRFYSIASGTAEEQVDILYDIVQDGLLTPRLARMRPGDALLCSTPFGAFRDARGASCWIATGTGIAPFISMARSGGTEEKLLVHGSKSMEGLVDRDFFIARMGPRYFPCCSREKSEGVFAGRPTEWLASRALPAVERYLLCGNSLMVVDVRDILIGKGIPFDNVVAEIYF
jgi:ferredoxin/flavodoxin---NADP+ reductase